MKFGWFLKVRPSLHRHNVSNQNMGSRSLLILFTVVSLSMQAQVRVPNGCYRNSIGHYYEFYNDSVEFIGVFGHTVKKGKGQYNITNDSLTINYEIDTLVDNRIRFVPLIPEWFVPLIPVQIVPLLGRAQF